jgi:hypothetical protein
MFIIVAALFFDDMSSLVQIDSQVDILTYRRLFCTLTSTATISIALQHYFTKVLRKKRRFWFHRFIGNYHGTTFEEYRVSVEYPNRGAVRKRKKGVENKIRKGKMKICTANKLYEFV